MLALAAVVGLAGCADSSGETAADAPRSSAAAATVTEDEESAGLAGYVREPVVEVGDLELLDFADDPQGEPFRLRAEPEGLLLVYFGYLSCPDVCPLTMVHVRDALAELDPAEAERVAVGMVTVDPERDEGPEIAAYLDHFFDRTVALRAPDDAALTEVGARFRARWEIEPHEPGDNYDVAHTAGVYALDEQGRIVREFPFGLEAEPLTRSLRLLLAEEAAAST